MRLQNLLVEYSAKVLRNNVFTKRFLYDPLKVFFRRRLCSLEYMLHYMRSNRKYDKEFHSSYVGGVKVKLFGVLRDPFGGHEPYLAACQDMGVGYKVVDIFAHDWIDQIKSSGCDTFLTWPGESIREWKQLYDDRLRFVVQELNKKVFPDFMSCWIYGSKERQNAWLALNNFCAPETWIFYDMDEANNFIEQNAKYPIVAKIDIGAVSSGVSILRSKKECRRYIKCMFKKGIQGYYSNPQTRQWRHILFQEYIADAKEWRVHRQGDSFFGFGKIKKGDFHSGSGETLWVPPPKEAFDLAWAITEKGGFKSMAVDIFETQDRSFLVNELQCVYGQHSNVQLMKEGKSGRYLRQNNGEWKFEEGVFSINHGCNLRIEAALKL